MIIQALADYYDRKAADPESGIAPPGWEIKEIPYLIVLDKKGIPVDVVCTIQGTGKSKTTKKLLVPRDIGITSGHDKANLLWGRPEYIVGVESKKHAAEKHGAFQKRIIEIGEVDDPGWKAVQLFLALSLDEKLTKLAPFQCWQQAQADDAFMTFKLVGEVGIVALSTVVRNAINQYNALIKGETIHCLVTNVVEQLEDKHAGLKVKGCDKRTKLVSFNKESFTSYNKKQGANAPIGKSAAFAYTTALKNLLQENSPNLVMIGEASTVFWSEKGDNSNEEHRGQEENITCLFREPPKDDPDRGVTAVKALYESVRTGAYADEKGLRRFFVLGLSPNAARLAVRFWIVSTVRNMAENIVQHFEDTKIVHWPEEQDILSLSRFLISVARKGKTPLDTYKNIPPLLEGDMMRAILENWPYPRTLLQAVIRRVRAERKVNYPRAAIIKACLNRQTRFKNNDIQEELHVSLDLENKNIGYRLGRLFAVLEKIQSEANPRINTTIRDRFYGAASGTPVSVFPNLMRLKNHHLSKLENKGRRTKFELMLCEITSEITDFPKNLSLDDQGRFAIGYYHQRYQLYLDKVKNSVSPKEDKVNQNA